MDIPKGNKAADLIYKNTSVRDLALTFLPPIQETYAKAPIYFLIPGGGWTTETRQSMIDFSAQSVEDLRNQGFAVVSIDYRISKEGAVMHEILCDCFDAARYISHFADVLGVDRNRFVCSGHSAGAHLALMLSYAPEDAYRDEYPFCDAFHVAAVAAMSAPTILYDNSVHHLQNNLSAVFSGCDTKEEREKESPVTHVDPNCPPTFLCAGTSDYLVFATSSERLYEALETAGVPCALMLSIGGGHIFEKIHSSIEPSVAMPEVQTAIRDFILKYGIQ